MFGCRLKGSCKRFPHPKCTLINGEAKGTHTLKQGTNPSPSPGESKTAPIVCLEKVF